mgnify:CR=1 FL=1
MSLTIESTKGISERAIVVEVVSKVIENPKVLLIISQVFSAYNKNTVSKEEIDSYIESSFNNPKFDLSAEYKEELMSNLKTIYNYGIDDFNNVRSEILENIVYHFGPCTISVKKDKVYVEPVIKDNDYIVGESDIKCDIVFFSSATTPIEFIECKTNIGNIIPRNLPFDKIKTSHQRKINYLNSAYHYIKDNYCEPYIYFACYNLNYELELQNLQKNWGYFYMDFINASEIIEGKIT